MRVVRALSDHFRHIRVKMDGTVTGLFFWSGTGTPRKATAFFPSCPHANQDYNNLEQSAHHLVGRRAGGGVLHVTRALAKARR